jgi:hypothetical protein
MSFPLVAKCGCKFRINRCEGCRADHVVETSERPSERCQAHVHTFPDTLNQLIADELNESATWTENDSLEQDPPQQ